MVVPLTPSAMGSSSLGQKMLQVVPLSGLVKVAAYMKTGIMSKAEAAQAVRLTHLAMTLDRNLGAEIGWQTAMYRSADNTVKKMELVNCKINKIVHDMSTHDFS